MIVFFFLLVVVLVLTNQLHIGCGKPSRLVGFDDHAKPPSIFHLSRGFILYQNHLSRLKGQLPLTLHIAVKGGHGSKAQGLLHPVAVGSIRTEKNTPQSLPNKYTHTTTRLVWIAPLLALSDSL